MDTEFAVGDVGTGGVAVLGFFDAAEELETVMSVARSISEGREGRGGLV